MPIEGSNRRRPSGGRQQPWRRTGRPGRFEGRTHNRHHMARDLKVGWTGLGKSHCTAGQRTSQAARWNGKWRVAGRCAHGRCRARTHGKYGNAHHCHLQRNGIGDCKSDETAQSRGDHDAILSRLKRQRPAALFHLILSLFQRTLDQPSAVEPPHRGSIYLDREACAQAGQHRADFKT